MVRAWPGSAGRISKLPLFQDRISLKASSPVKSAGGGVDDFAVLHPDFALNAPLGDVENGGAAGEAFQLDQVHQALALHAAESSFVARFRGPRSDSMQSWKSSISSALLGFCQNNSTPWA